MTKGKLCMLTGACDNIDRLVCVEMRRKGLPVGFKTVLYDKLIES